MLIVLPVLLNDITRELRCDEIPCSYRWNNHTDAVDIVIYIYIFQKRQAFVLFIVLDLTDAQAKQINFR